MAFKKYNISVCIIAHPDEKHLPKCLESLEIQTFKPKEIIVHKEVGSFSKLRNKVIEKSKYEIIVFIDADCYAEKHWLEEINRIFQDKSIIGFHGKVCYGLNGKFPTASTRIITNDGQDTMTANAGFRADILKKVKFDEEINYLEDKILFSKISKYGKLIYSNDAIVFHEYKEWNFKQAIKYAKKVEDFLKANKKYNFPIQRIGPIIYPQHFLIIFFPPLLFFFNSIRSSKDLKITIANYIEKIYTRFLIWKYAIRNGEFFI